MAQHVLIMFQFFIKNEKPEALSASNDRLLGKIDLLSNIYFWLFINFVLHDMTFPDLVQFQDGYSG